MKLLVTKCCNNNHNLEYQKKTRCSAHTHPIHAHTHKNTATFSNHDYFLQLMKYSFDYIFLFTPNTILFTFSDVDFQYIL